MATAGINIPDPSVLSGSEVQIYLDNTLVAFGTSVEPDYNYNLREIRGIGSWFALGVKSMFFSGNVSMSLHLLSQPEDGVAPLPVLEEILTTGPQTLEFREKGTGRRIMRVIGKLSSESSRFSVDDLTSRRIQFMIIRVQHLEGYN